MLFISWERLDEHQGMQLRYSESWVNEQRSEARQDEYYMGCGRIRAEFSIVPQYGESVLNLLDIPPGASVLDLGCGNGVLTRRLADMGYRVIGLDDSSEMLEIAARTYPDLCFMHGDATDFSLPEPVDAVFSNAVFHWIDDQDALLERIALALRPNGQLVCEFGGRGCVESVHASLEKSFAVARIVLSAHILFSDYRRICSPTGSAWSARDYGCSF